MPKFARKKKGGAAAPSTEFFYGALTPSRRVAVHDWNGRVLIDIRETYHSSEGKPLPGKKGISLTPEQWTLLQMVSKDVDAAVALALQQQQGDADGDSSGGSGDAPPPAKKVKPAAKAVKKEGAVETGAKEEDVKPKAKGGRLVKKSRSEESSGSESGGIPPVVVVP